MVFSDWFETTVEAGPHVLNVKNRESNTVLRTVQAMEDSDACFRPVPQRFTVLSVDHSSGDGTYFNFLVDDAESALGGSLGPTANCYTEGVSCNHYWTVKQFRNYIPVWEGT